MDMVELCKLWIIGRRPRVFMSGEVIRQTSPLFCLVLAFVPTVDSHSQGAVLMQHLFCTSYVEQKQYIIALVFCSSQNNLLALGRFHTEICTCKNIYFIWLICENYGLLDDDLFIWVEGVPIAAIEEPSKDLLQQICMMYLKFLQLSFVSQLKQSKIDSVVRRQILDVSWL